MAEASHNGMRVDEGVITTKIAELTVRIDERSNLLWASPLGKLWRKIYGDKSNANSDHQLRSILFDKLHYDAVKTTETGAPAVDYETLAALPDNDVKHLIAVSKLSKVRDTYLKSLAREQVNGWIHPNFNLHLVTTFRSSSDHPNFHNIPKRDAQSRNLVRSVIFPREGHQFMSADFSGIEVRIAACYHQDPTMLSYINDPTTDMHRDMAIQLFDLKAFDKSCSGDKHLRQGAKNGFVFPQFYGDYYGNNAKILIEYARTCPDLSDGSKILDQLSDKKLVKLNNDGKIVNYNNFTDHVRDVEAHFWGKRFQVYQEWKEEFYAKYQKNGYIDLLTGFRCSGVMNRNEVINYPVQGSAFHCLLWSFNKIFAISKRQEWDSRLVGQIHDDMILDVEPSELEHIVRIVRKVTCKLMPANWSWIIVPIDIEIELAGVDDPWVKLDKYKEDE